MALKIPRDLYIVFITLSIFIKCSILIQIRFSKFSEVFGTFRRFSAVQYECPSDGKPVALRCWTLSAATKPGGVWLRLMQKLDQLVRPVTHSASARLKIIVDRS